MPAYHKSSFVAELLKTDYSRLAYLVRMKRVCPARDESGDWLWDEAAIEAARIALASIRPHRKRASAHA